MEIKAFAVPFTVSIMIIIVSAFLAAVAQLFLKIAANTIYNAFPPIENLWDQIIMILSSPFLYVGLFAYGLSTLIWLIILSREDLGLAYPLLSFSYLFGLILAWVVLGEEITVNKYIGTPIICLGITIILRDKTRKIT